MDRSKTYLEAARNAIRTKQSWVAVAKLKELLELEPGLAEAYELLGVAHLMASDKAAAKEAFQKSVDIAPERVSGHFNFANFLAQIGELDDAAEEIQAANYLAPNHAGIMALHASISQRLRDRHSGATEGYTVACVSAVSDKKNVLLDKLKCPYCNGMNNVMVRVCRHCNMRLPDEKPLVVME